MTTNPSFRKPQVISSSPKFLVPYGLSGMKESRFACVRLEVTSFYDWQIDIRNEILLIAT